MSELSDWKQYVHEPIVEEFTRRLERKDAKLKRLREALEEARLFIHDDIPEGALAAINGALTASEDGTS